MGLIYDWCVNTGDEIVAANNLVWWVRLVLYQERWQEMGFKTHFINPTDLEALKAAINDKNKNYFLLNR